MSDIPEMTEQEDFILNRVAIVDRVIAIMGPGSSIEDVLKGCEELERYILDGKSTQS